MTAHALAAHSGARLENDIAHSPVSADQYHQGAAPDDTIVSGTDYSLNGTDGADVIHSTDAYVFANGEGGGDLIDHAGSALQFLSGYSYASMGAGVDGSDTIHGGAGTDYIEGCAGADTLYGGAGDDFVYGAVLSSTEQSSDGADYIDLGAGNDYARGNDGADTIIGGSGSDTLNGQWGNDSLDGGSGFDYASYTFAGATTGVTFDGSSFVSGATQTLSDGLGGTDTLASIEALSITGTAYADVLTGSSSNDVIVGQGGADQLQGGGGDDVLTAGAGDATLLGGAGDDKLQVVGSGTSHEVLHGGGGVDVASVDWSGTSSAVHLRLTNGGLLTGSSADGALSVHGDGIATATLTGGSGDDTISTGKGNDVIDGGHGDDVLHAGGGFDVYYVDEGGEQSNGFSLDASGLDIKGGASVVTGTSTGTDHLTGFEAVEIIGSHFSDTIVGSDGADTLTDGAKPDQLGYDSGQQDSISGGDGNDSIYYSVQYTQDRLSGGAGIDTLYCSSIVSVVVDLTAGTASGLASSSTSLISGFEHIIGGSAADTMLGSDARETLEGGAGKDVLNGGGGRDVLIGGDGADVLTGGKGHDTFRFGPDDLGGKAAQDQITDLQKGDVIDLRGIDADRTTAGDQAFHIVAEFDHHGGELVLSYDAASNQTLVQGDVDGDGVADLSIAIHGDHHDFTNFQL